jgi:hypothetical protein
LAGLAPLRDIVRPPYRPDPNRGRGQPRHGIEEDFVDSTPLLPQLLTPLERHAFEYNALEEAMAHLDTVVRRARDVLAMNRPNSSPSRVPHSVDTQPDTIRVDGA